VISFSDKGLEENDIQLSLKAGNSEVLHLLFTLLWLCLRVFNEFYCIRNFLKLPTVSTNTISLPKIAAVVTNSLAPSGLLWATPLGLLLTTETISVCAGVLQFALVEKYMRPILLY